MVKQLVRSLFLSVLPLCLVNTALANNDSSTKIIDGTLVPATQFPSVALVNLPDSICSGTLINSRFVLTAAHCFFDEKNRLIGNLSGVSAVLNNHAYAAKKVTVHPTYVSREEACIEGEEDAAIIELASEVTETAPIPIYRNAPAKGDSLLLVGFGTQGNGATGEDDTLPPDGYLRYGSTSADTISQSYISWIFNRGESNTASGDSGGPAFIDIAGTRYLHSITCGGTGNSEFGSESSNTRLDVILSWIDSIAGTSAPSTPPSFGGLATQTLTTNAAFSYAVLVSGSAPVTLTATDLPPGLALSGFTVAGIPTAAGTYTSTLVAENSFGRVSGSLTFVVSDFDPEAALSISKVVVNFNDDGSDLLVIKGTVTLPAGFNPQNSRIRLQIAGFADQYKLNRQGYFERSTGYDYVILKGKLSKGSFVNPTVTLQMNLGDKYAMYKKLFKAFPSKTKGLGSDYRLNLPVELTINGNTYHREIPMKFKRRGIWQNQ